MAGSNPYPSDLQVSSDDRHYINNIVIKDDVKETEFREKLRASIAKKLKYLEENYDPFKEKYKDVYVGTGGIAMLYFHLANTYVLGDLPLRDKYLQKSLALVQDSLKVIKKCNIAFLHGPAGLYSIGAVAHRKLKHEAESQEYIHLLIDMFGNLVKKKPFPSELLYGHSGYLHSLLFVNHHIPGSIPDGLIKDLVTFILKAGKSAGASLMNCPLSYSWHSKYYIGGAHGMAGIACQLLQVNQDKNPELKPLLISFIEYIISVQKTNGNFPSSIESGHRDTLVQFCHGAPGVLPMLCLAKSHKLGVARLAEATESAADVTWTRGLLTKGHNLCHGVSGNAYAFLSLFRHTHDSKYLRQARAFAEWIMDREDTEGTPDNPFSLFEGLAGELYFLADMIDPMKSAFPCFEIPHN
ncbi:LanC-like protein 2 [Oopsacas minuta]|uniref:LanC-like protein 2 n=1 Tax=Oopsacas minuta TaxID=111878 RepID=A0AAV7KE74_9METZ|nr:LanC-like protein 2 [Oopsacas minuta]